MHAAGGMTHLHFATEDGAISIENPLASLSEIADAVVLVDESQIERNRIENRRQFLGRHAPARQLYAFPWFLDISCNRVFLRLPFRRWVKQAVADLQALAINLIPFRFGECVHAHRKEDLFFLVDHLRN